MQHEKCANKKHSQTEVLNSVKVLNSLSIDWKAQLTFNQNSHFAWLAPFPSVSNVIFEILEERMSCIKRDLCQKFQVLYQCQEEFNFLDYIHWIKLIGFKSISI